MKKLIVQLKDGRQYSGSVLKDDDIVKLFWIDRGVIHQVEFPKFMVEVRAEPT